MLMRAVRWGLAGVLVAWTVIRLLGWDSFWPIVPLFALTPWVAALALVGTVAAAVFGRRAFALLVGACALALIVAIAPRVVPNRAPAGTPGPRLRVLAANTAGQTRAARGIVALARRLRVDVLCVAELTPETMQAYQRAGIDAALPHQSLQPLSGFRGTGVYARVPLARAPSPSSEPGAAAATLQLPGAAMAEIHAVHVTAPTKPGHIVYWRQAMQRLPSAGSGPVVQVVAGDFNATLDHAELRRLIGRGYRDAAEQAGSGLRMTWPTDKSPLPALMAIDHVLADRRIRVASARTVTIPGSDHRGVLADLVLTGG